MTIPEPDLYEHLEEAVAAVERRDLSWREDMITIDSVPSSLSSTAKAYHYLATTAALLGASEQARKWFGEKARWYLNRTRPIASDATFESPRRGVTNHSDFRELFRPPF